MPQKLYPYNPDYVVPPGETIQECLKERDMSATALAQHLQLQTSHVDALLNGQAKITRSIARALQRTFGISSTFWVRLQRNYESRLDDDTSTEGDI